jgi:broad specificity phosphatase PhoE
MKVRVVAVRHAERVDEAPAEPPGRVPWARAADPPLTARGERQSAAAGRHIARVTAAAGSYEFRVVHASPYVRCAQTATAISRALGYVPLHFVYGLAACALAYKKAFAAGSVPDFESSDGIREMCGDAAEVTFSSEMPHAASNPFVPAVEQLARMSADTAIAGGRDNCPAILIVTHREGLFELDQASGETARFQMPYVVVHEYDYDCKQKSWSLVRDSPILKPVLRVQDVRDTRHFPYTEEIDGISIV